MQRSQQASEEQPAGQADNPGVGSAFLLAQLGGHAARVFSERIDHLELTPAQAGVLRLVAQHPGRSQQALAEQLRAAPSKVVALVDALEARHLLERRRSTADRRQYALHLTDTGRQLLQAVSAAALEHDADLLAALDDDERRHLQQLLQRVADQQGLGRGVHPGYRDPSPP